MTIADEAGSATSVGELGLVITSRPLAAGAEDMAVMEADPLVGSGWDSVCSVTDKVVGTDSISSIAMEKVWRWVDVE